ncbi:MAG TPA: flagellar hook-basal body complex protein FliE [Alphaproteobacteria bacterium]|nr:flagellar hook-basal body complex protein FliE [Alphaproteobacteria bacterium]
MAINSVTSGLSPLAGLTPSTGTSSATPAGGALGSFGDMVKDLVSQSVTASQNSEQLATAVAQGQPIPLNEVIQAVSKAELTLQTLITVRDRAVEAYQQIQQMPI